MKKYYLYQHTTISTSIPFYIGIGTKQYGEHENIKLRYARAYSKTGRSNFWKRIVKKYDYKIDILFQSNSYDQILKKEIYYIKKIGRRDLKQGTLCNLTDGGEGCLNIIFSSQTKLKMSNTAKENIKKGVSFICSDKFKKETSKRMKNNKYAVGTILSKEQKDNLLKNRLEKLSKRVIQEDIKGNFIKEWYTTVEAANHFGITYKAIWKACKNYNIGAKSKGFCWKFKENGNEKDQK